MTFALAGNQNSGKTTLFNQLTGSNQRVGNFPGVTVEQKTGNIIGHSDISVVDLPGIYSLSPYSSEEIVTRDFLLKQKPDALINIVDATNIERNLYLTLQLIELQIPMVVALNMMDEVQANSGNIDILRMREILGIPVVPISAVKKQGISELIEQAIETAQTQKKPERMDICSGPVHTAIHAITHTMEDKLNTDRLAALVDMRYQFIEGVCGKCVTKAQESREYRRSVAFDTVLTHKFLAYPAFLGIMFTVFWLTFGVIGTPLSGLLEDGIASFGEIVGETLLSYGLNPIIHSLIIDGIFAGVGAVLSFIPIIITMFFFLSLLEDSGYMARVAYVMDKPLRKIGLSGRSFVPMLMGFGCSVPAVMATRTLASERDRKMTIFLTPFMSCSAKIPIYALFTAVFFTRYQALVMTSLYVIGIALGVLSGFIMRKTVYKGTPVPFVMELPNYRFPSIKTVLLLLWDKAKDFIQRACTVIFIAAVVIWFLQSFDIRLNYVDSADSVLAAIGQGIGALFAPLGFADWHVATSLITGFMAKEVVISTLAVLIGSSEEALGSGLHNFFTPLAAYSFLVFTLLYTPCVAAVATVRRELGSLQETFFIIVYQTGLAWLCAFGVYQIGSIFGG